MRTARPHYRFLLPSLLIPVLLLATVGGALAAPPERLIASDNAFLRSSRVEVGARPNGSFGTDINAPDGTWNPRDVDNSGTRVGFRYLRSGTWETGVTDGDFFLPGGPYEGWGVEVVGGASGFRTNTDGRTQIPGTFSLGTGSTEVVWTATGPVDGIAIVQRYSVPVDGTPRLRMDVEYTNTTGADLDVIYFRGVDADNCVEPEIADPEGPCKDIGYSTTNIVVEQRHDGGDRSAVASAGEDGSVLVLWTEAADSVAYFDTDFCAAGVAPAEILAEARADRFSTLAAPFTDSSCGTVIVTAVDEEQFEDSTIGLAAQVRVPANGSASLTAYYELSGAAFGLGDAPEEEVAPVGGSTGPSFVPRDGEAPTVAPGSGELQRNDGARQLLAVTQPAQNQIRYEVDGFSVTLTGASATSSTQGLSVIAGSDVECEICALLAAGAVIEAWMFSEPRLVAAWRVEDLPCQRFTIPTGAPLDGRGALPPGAHTLQFALPTAQGMQAMNIGVTVLDARPISVRAGEGVEVSGIRTTVLPVLAAVLAAGALARRRRAAQLIG
jgi:hypothetical protein